MKILEEHSVPAIDKSIRLQEYAALIFTQLPTRSAVKKAIKKELLYIDDQVASTATWIKEGQKISLYAQKNTTKKIFKLDLKVLFEDNQLAVIVKPGGYPTNGNYFKTIENALPHNLSPSTAPDALTYPIPVHRLDNPTSGLLIVAKTITTRQALHLQFEEKKVNKTYQALITGKFLQKTGKFSTPIAQKKAETYYTQLKTYKTNTTIFSLVELKPITGRTHQLRIHLSEAKHPIIGDISYGSTISTPNIMLTATGIKFQHPTTLEELSFTLECPKKFLQFIRKNSVS
ncbi:tRNA pseudouridine65 synthase/23S rRNA pseudouridine1911/1915/1917 synthase [Mesonia hippocampi]|uniref:tRNA pseudouridine65 synthase/23S rRNA pseudouridine1911/1915/1917 synthase n=1 Tax=Mesonia hippocampi TaxID=1628250 RepID=A0A840ETH9_9FLAO|nr:RluA family pseudouridine synthase [Mesonia hippocampi]MBB4118217.1 tRNA pseudouridine65 synthase/23S rRNA pseudouridine1911/1915/1917 synthase [Mesonia hippocampi]